MFLQPRYVLRVCDHNFQSYRGFQWPQQVGEIVSAPDWEPTHACGSGLHGWYEGRGNILSAIAIWANEPNPQWMVLRVEGSQVIHLDGKCKFPQAEVVYHGTRQGAADLIKDLTMRYCGVIGEEVEVPKYQSVASAAMSVVHADDESCVHAQRYSQVLAKNRCVINVESNCVVHAGDHCRVFTHSDSVIRVGRDCEVNLRLASSITVRAQAGTVIRREAFSWTVGVDCPADQFLWFYYGNGAVFEEISEAQAYHEGVFKDAL